MVDDGSRDPVVPDVVDELAGRLPIVGVRIRHAGRAAAKNLAVMLARAPVVLFFDDDDRAAPDYLERHLAGHEAQPGEAVAVLGHTDWAPELARSPLMHYVTDVDRMLFAYERLGDGQVLDWRGFWEGRCRASGRCCCGTGSTTSGSSTPSTSSWRGGSGHRPAGRVRRVGGEPDGPADRRRRLRGAVGGEGPGARHGGGAPPRHRDRRPAWSRPAPPSCGGRSQAVEPLRRRIAELEEPAEDEAARPELHAAYRELFRLLHAKGVATVAEPDGEAAADFAGSGALPPTPAPGGGPGPELVHDGIARGRGPAARSSASPSRCGAARPSWRTWPAGPSSGCGRWPGSRPRWWWSTTAPRSRSRSPPGSTATRRTGVSVGWNTGIRLSSAPVIAVLNSDCWSSPAGTRRCWRPRPTAAASRSPTPTTATARASPDPTRRGRRAGASP